MNRIAGRAGVLMILILMLVAGFTFFVCEYAIESDNWVIFPGSPHVYNGGNIGYGIVTDRDGVLLLDMSNERTYASDSVLRQATVHWLGDRNGSVDAPALPSYAAQMLGFNLMTGIYSYGNAGGKAELTLSAKVQVAALEALGNYKGTVGIYNYKTGEIICAVSTPSFDPDNIPDVESDATGKYEGMYLNRFTQSVYIPGSIFKIVTLAAALETIPDIQEQTFVCRGSYEYGKDKITCEGAHWNQTLKDAFRNSCNCAFAQIADQLGREVLQRYADQFQITQSLTFDGITTSAGNFDIHDAAQVSVAWSSIGQYTDQINACRYMTFLGAIAGGGKGAHPHIVSGISAEGKKTYTAKTVMGDRIMSQSTAQTLQEYLRENVVNKYGADNFPGMTVCAKTGTAEVGGDKKPNAMLTGFVADEQYPYAFIVAVEDGGYGRAVCVPILSKILAACREASNG